MSISVSKEHQFKDKFVFYRFHDDAEGRGEGPAGRKPSNDAAREAQQKKDEVIIKKETCIIKRFINCNPWCVTQVISTLTQLAPDAVLKAILRKP